VTLRTWVADWRRLAVALIACAGLVSVSGCSATTGSERDFLRIGSSDQIDSLNPFVGEGDYAYATWLAVYPYLVQYNHQLKIVPDFARSWKVSDHGLVWTFHTVPGAHWSDGRPLTAHDVVWNIDLDMKFKNGPTAAASSTVAGITSARAPNDNTVVIHYRRPVSDVLAIMTGLPVLPPQVWGRYAVGKGKGLLTYANTNSNVSGGPFQIVKYTQNQLILFERNPRWWGQKPKLKGFGVEFFSDTDAMVSALEHNELDLIEEFTPVTAISALRHAHMVVDATPGLAFKDFIINTNQAKTNHRELLNPLVREAMEYAINRRQIINVAFLGYAQPGASIIGPADQGWTDPKIKGLPFSIAKANALLNQAGYKRGPGGIRIADGHPMSYTVIFPTDENGAGDRTFQIIQQDFQQIGIRIEQRTLDDDAATAAIDGSNSKYKTFDLAMWDWSPAVDPYFILSVLECSAWGNASDSGYCNKSYDHMYQEQSQAIDPAVRHRIVDEMQEKIFHDRPYIVLDYPDVIQAADHRWAGLQTYPEQGTFNSVTILPMLGVHPR
jgi:peptide/nickel transport system substrate-binding protein